MHIIKIQTSSKTYFINCGQILHFHFDIKDEKTHIKLCDGTTIEADGDLVHKLARIVISATNGNLLNLE